MIFPQEEVEVSEGEEDEFLYEFYEEILVNEERIIEESE